MSILNHLKKNESINDKQLVIFNSDYRDDINQTTSSFTYSFNEPIDRISKIEISDISIPKTYYNVNNDNSSMNITINNINETYDNKINIDDLEIKNNIFNSTNELNGSFIDTNIFTSSEITSVHKVISYNANIYICGIFSNGIFDLFNKKSDLFKPILNTGDQDIFVCKYDIQQNFIWRFKIGGILDELTTDISCGTDFVIVTGISTSYEVVLYNIIDINVYKIQGYGSPISFFAKYTAGGSFEWAIYILGVLNEKNKCYIIESTHNFIYITGCFNNTNDLQFYDKNNILQPASIIPSDKTGICCSFIAQYTIDGIFKWVNTIYDNCIIKSLNMNPVTKNPLIGLEFCNTIIFYQGNSVSSTSPRVSLGISNLLVVEIEEDGNYTSPFLIDGSGSITNIRIDTQDTKLVITGLYTSNPIRFNNTWLFYNSENLNQFMYLSGNKVNMFLAVYEIYNKEKKLLWRTNAYSYGDLSNVDISISPLFDIVISLNYSNILKFNDINGYVISRDLNNTSGLNYLCLCSYDINGKFQYNNRIEPINGNIDNRSIDAKSNRILISSTTNSTLIKCFNVNSNVIKTSYNLQQTPIKYYGNLFSYVSNVNNFIIDKTTLPKTIIKKIFDFFNLSYVINLNSFSQNLGFITSKKLNPMIFGNVINWSTLIITDSNNLLKINFVIYSQKTGLYTNYTNTFIIKNATYTPYSLSFELSKAFQLLLKYNNNINDTLSESETYVTYDNIKNMFYIMFNVIGIFSIVQNNLSNDLNLTYNKSLLCAISYINNASDKINIQDGSKITLKLFDNDINQLYINDTFNLTFPNISLQTSNVYLNVIENKNVNMTLIGNVNQNNDIQLNDTIIFDSPWLQGDTIQTSFLQKYEWCGSAISTDGLIMCLIAKNNFIYISTDRGIIWRQKCIQANWTAIAISNTIDGNCIISATAKNNTIYTSENSGLTWKSKDSVRNWYDICVSYDGILQIAIEFNGYVYRSDNKGLSWNSIISLGINNWTSVSIYDQVVIVCAYNGLCYKWLNDGLLWSTINIVDEWVSSDIYLLNNVKYAMLVSRLGYVYKYNLSTDECIKIIIDATNKSAILSKITVSNTGIFQTIIGNIGDLYYSMDYGNDGSWVKSGIIDSWGAVSISKNRLNSIIYQISAINNGDIYKNTYDGGDLTLTSINAPEFIGICISSTGLYQVAYTTDTLYQSVDGGNNWKRINSFQNIDSIAISNDGNLQMLCTDTIVYKTTNKWLNFTTITSVNGYGGIKISGSGKIQLINKFPLYIKISRDYGNTWNTLDEQFNGSEYPYMYSISNNGKNITILYKNYIYISNDSGINFTNIYSKSLYSDISISNDGKYQTKVDPDIINVTTSNNYGLSWTDAIIEKLWNTTSKIVISASGQYQLLINSKKLYTSNNYGQTWAIRIKNISPSNISLSSDGKFQSAIINGNIYQSTNYGIKWYKIYIVYTNLNNINYWQSSSISNNSKYINSAIPTIISSSNNYGTSYQLNKSHQLQQNYNNVMSGDGKIQLNCNNGNDNNESISVDYGKSWNLYSLNTTGPGICDIISDDSYYYIIIVGTLNNIQKLYYTKLLKSNLTSFIPFIPFEPLNLTNCISVKMKKNSNNISIFCFQSDRNIKYSNDFGTNWNNYQIIPNIIEQINDADISNDSQIVVLVGYNYLYKSTNGIDGLYTKYTIPLISGKIKLLGDNGNDIVIMNIDNNNKSFIYKSADGGISWTKLPLYTNWSYLNRSEDAKSLIANINNGLIKYSYNMGVTWLSQPSRTQPASLCMSLSGQYQTVVSAGRGLYTSNNYGKTWIQSSEFVNNWKKITMDNTGQYQNVIPYYGKIIVSSDFGITWTEQNNLFYWIDVVICSNIKQYAIIIDNSGNKAIYNSINLWTTLSLVQQPPALSSSNEWSNICFSGNNLYISITDGYIYSLNTQTLIWSNSIISKKWSSLCAMDKYVIATVYGGFIYISIDNGINFYEYAGIKNWHSSSISLYLGIYTITVTTFSGTIYYSNDYGITWSNNNINGLWKSVSAGTQYVSAVDYNNNIYNSIDSSKVWYITPDLFELNSVGINQDSSLLVVSQNNGLIYLSNDYGLTFEPIPNDDKVTSYTLNWSKIVISNKISNTNKYIIIAIAYDNYVYLSSDNGIIFNKVLTIGLNGIGQWISCDLSETGQYITVLDYNGNMYKSNDYGNTWLNIINSHTWVSISISASGQYQNAVSQDYILSISNDYGQTWTRKNINNIIYQDICISSSGQFQTAVSRGYSIYTSSDYGQSWINKNIIKNWNKIKTTDTGVQIALVDQEQKIYYTSNLWADYISIDTNYIYKDIAINGDGLFQFACSTDNVYYHNNTINSKITLNVQAITNNSVSDNINNIISFSETSLSQNLLPIHGFNLSNGFNYNLIRNTTSKLIDIYVTPANYTPQTLVNAINKLILQINPNFINPFNYIENINKITLTSNFSGSIISNSLLLDNLGFTEIPMPALANITYIGNNTVNKNLSGAKYAYIKSDIITNVKKNKTASSTTKPLNSLIAPLFLDSINNLHITMPIEIFLSKKTTFTTIDIQIVDENNNIINLNGGNVQINMYFISS